jgi:hypothetical protein
MNIEQLLEKYFEGETSSQEEKFLREYFSSYNIDEKFIQYAPLFQYFKDEIAKNKLGQQEGLEEGITVELIPENDNKKETIITSYKFWASVAAVVAICFAVVHNHTNTTTFSNKSYAMIDGKYHTEDEIIKHAFLASIQEIIDDEVQLFPKDDNDVRDIISNDISEFKDMFE